MVRGRAIPGQRGFTLIELLIVLGIISVLVWALLPAVVEAMWAGNEAQTKARIQHLQMCVDRYAVNLISTTGAVPGSIPLCSSESSPGSPAQS